MSWRSSHRRLLAGGGALTLVAAAAIATAAVEPFGGGSGDGVARAAAATDSTAAIASGRLSSQVYANGTLGYSAQADGTPYAIVNQRKGAYTSLPQVTHIARCGKGLYRIDDVPVLLLCGDVPAWRSLYEGMAGPDVRQLNRNLVELGYATRDELDPRSDTFSAATSHALGELQEKRDLDWTGSLRLGDAVFAPGPLRITKVTATLGTSAGRGAPMAQATSTRRRVDVDLKAAQASSVGVGDPATITLPDNSTTTGVVSRVGTVASAGRAQSGGSDSSGATIPVAIALDRPRVAGRLDRAPVGVQITTGRVRDALSVPVTALVARAGGGYAVETVAGDGRRELVPVRLGLFDPADGRVQVESPGLSTGQRVVVPST
ncbi:MAG TPA: efflux RND transporter periplasmic adaptor subunit [Conexibacter sp.]|nr:efflux RND transporter periplasmic adaptor subunit [Conexibacter sp.]